MDCGIFCREGMFLQPNLAAAIHKLQSTRTLGISWIAAHGLLQPQCTSCNPRDGSFLPRGLRQLVDCGSAAVGVEALQYKPFYMVSYQCATVPRSFKENFGKGSNWSNWNLDLTRPPNFEPCSWLEYLKYLNISQKRVFEYLNKRGL